MAFLEKELSDGIEKTLEEECSDNSYSEPINLNDRKSGFKSSRKPHPLPRSFDAMGEKG